MDSSGAREQVPPRQAAMAWPPVASWAVGLLAAYAFLVLVQALLAYLAERERSRPPPS